MPAAAGHISSTRSNARPDERRQAAWNAADRRDAGLAQAQQPDAAIATAIAISGAGERGAKRSSAEDQREHGNADRDRGDRSMRQLRAIANRSRKKPVFSIWMPSSLGTWSTTITSPMPDLKPVSTGSEMKLATKPRRSTDAATSMRAGQDRERRAGSDQGCGVAAGYGAARARRR